MVKVKYTITSEDKVKDKITSKDKDYDKYKVKVNY